MTIRHWGNQEDMTGSDFGPSEPHDPSIEMPKPKYPSMDRQHERYAMAKKMKGGEIPSTIHVLPGESAADFRKRIEAASVLRGMERTVNHIRPSVQKPVRIFERGSKIPLKERALHRLLVLWRKAMRKRDKRGTDAYRRSTEALIAQHARVNNQEVQVSYRHKGKYSHTDQEKINIDLSAVKKQYAGSAVDRKV